MDGLLIDLLASWIASLWAKIRDRQFTERASGVKAVMRWRGGGTLETEFKKPWLAGGRDADAS